MVILGSAAGPSVSLVMFAILGNDWKLHVCQLVIYIGLSLFLLPIIILFYLQPIRTDKMNVDITIPHKTEATSVYMQLSTTSEVEIGDRICTDDGDNSVDIELIDQSPPHNNSETSNNACNNPGGDEEGAGIEKRFVKQMVNTPNVVYCQRQESGKDVVTPSGIKTDDMSTTHYLVNTNDNNIYNNDNDDNRYGPIIGSVPLTPAMIACGDIVSGLASGMTIKFFPIFFMQSLQMKPIEVNALYVVSF